MGNVTVHALRAVLAVLLAGSLFVQAVLIPLLAIDMEGMNPRLALLRVPVLVILLLGVITVQAVLVCTWRLVTMARRGTVFSRAAFRYVHAIIGAFVAAAFLVFALAALMTTANHRISGDAVAPGIVLLVCGIVVALLGVALIVLVLRMLLAQAISRDFEAAQLRAELNEVI
ncbi:DUF2975 domain-containing protein [Actinopolyspora sp. H202]|uniref:DUF2975 domain-containing protein n=1 Tax=Actinopolyspora sp. H202 TaxID=1500456 RepID=UPI003EE713C0